MMSDKTVEEISECSVGLDNAAKERILKLCEKKMGISEGTDNNNKIEKSAQVKKYTAPKWHKTAFAAAACLILVTGLVLIKNNIKTSDLDTKNPVVTSQPEETIQTSVSQTTENTETQNTETNENAKYETITDEMALKYQEAENVFTHYGEMRANIDYSDEYSVDGVTYYKVSDPRFSSKQDVYDFIKDIYCKKLADEDCSMLIETIFLENDGKLYIRPKEEKSWWFDNWVDFPAEIINVTEDTFTAVKRYRSEGSANSVIFNFIQEDGEWKIASSRYDYSDRENEELSLPVDAYREFEDNNYNLFVEKNSIQDAYEYSDPYLMPMPEKIEEYENYVVQDIRDKESVYIRLGNSQVGIYNFVNKTYSAIRDITEDDMVRCFTDDYLIIQKRDYMEYISNPNAPSSLSYYDIKQKKSKVIYENIILTSHDFVIYNNCLYFDGYTRFETLSDKDCAVYKYDFATGELTTVRENALMPVLINGSVAALITNPETGVEDTIQVIEGNNNFKYDIEPNCIDVYCANNQLYGLYQEDETFTSIKELSSQNTIISSYTGGRQIFVSDSNDKILGLSSGRNYTQIPCVYDLKESKIVEFDNLGYNSYNVYLKDNYGVIVCYDLNGIYPYKNKITFFQLKNH